MSSLALLGTRLRSFPAYRRQALPRNDITAQSPRGEGMNGGLAFVSVKEIMRMDVAVNHLTMTVNMLMDEIHPEQKILVSENFIHPSYFLDAMFF